jgi:hypothetical protein
MVAAAQANPDFAPQIGDVVAVIVDPLEDQIPIDPPYINEWGEHYRWQITFIEVPVPEIHEGLTPGFWKNKGVKVGWPYPYNTSSTLWEAGFVLPEDPMDDNRRRPVNQNDSLMDALNYKGGKGDSGMAQSLLRAATAALLNAAHLEVSYPLTVAQVIAQVNLALAGDRDDMEDVKDILDGYNNLGADEWW